MEGIIAQFVCELDCNRREGGLIMEGRYRGGSKGVEDPA
jgi:hypothetical protein